MRYGIISDVHGNLEALNACLEALHGANIQRMVCLGDIVGYGAQPDECCDLVRSVCDVTVLGNHDAMLCGLLDIGSCHEAAQEAIRYCVDHLSVDNTEWLKELAYREDEDEITFCHGSPLDVEEFDYVFTLRAGAELNETYSKLSKLSFVGHSHLTVSYLVTARMALQLCAPRFQIHDGVKYVFNVGSVGQPRDRDSRACCVIYDDEEGVITYLRVPYDIQTAAQKIFDAGLPSVFGERLFLGT
jgi:diadenosine tetraphosphatase ApaH/serine/threonine PP2A family protein phosphatase